MKSKSSGRRARNGSKPRTDLRRTSPVVVELPPVVKPEPQPPSDYVRIFERLFRSFRMHAFEHLGDSYGGVITRAEKKICLLAPEYDRQGLTDETAPLIVDVVEEVVRNAPFFRRQKLRRAAIVLIADLYNKHYQMLEERNAIERIEQVYYRLKS